jgi:hypothetical protein
MSLQQEAGLLVSAEPDRVRAILLDPQALADWNPAFLSISGSTTATVGEPYPITVRPGLSGTFAYTEISDLRIDTTWSVPGFREYGTWELQPRSSETLVTHRFEHVGLLGALLQRANHGVAELRLNRLAQRVATQASPRSL